MPLQRDNRPIPPSTQSVPFAGQDNQPALHSRDPSQHRDDHLRNGSQQRIANQNVSDPQWQRRRENAAALKMDVPNTLEPTSMKHQVSRSTSDDGERPASRQDFRKGFAYENKQRNHGGDTSAVDSDNTSMWNLSYPDDIGTEPPVEQTVVFNPIQNLPMVLGPNWKSDVATARQHLGPMASLAGFVTRQVVPFGQYGVNNDMDDEQDDDNNTEAIDEEFQSLQHNTPSRVHNLPPRAQKGLTKPEVKSKKATFAEHPAEDQNRSFPASKDTAVEADLLDDANRQNLDQNIDTRQKKHSSKSTTSLPTRGQSNKIASFPDSSSEDERQPSPVDHNIQTVQEHTNPPSKRPHDTIDYSPETLKLKTFDDLSSIPFLTDPRKPPNEPAIDATGNPMSLSAKLTNLSKMRPEDQETLFQSLTDAENAETGEWFMNKFAQDLKRLTQVRLERRKITLEFELDVQKREALVKQKTRAVEQELMGLKKGGGDLIRGRSPGLVTPRKA